MARLSAARNEAPPPRRLNRIAQLEAGLARRTADGLARTRRTIESPQGARVIVGGRELISFASNDYLNLSTDGRVHDAIRRTLGKYGVGAGSSRVAAGFSYIHRQLEVIPDMIGGVSGGDVDQP